MEKICPIFAAGFIAKHGVAPYLEDEVNSILCQESSCALWSHTPSCCVINCLCALENLGRLSE
jgi:hypothetical protein